MNPGMSIAEGQARVRVLFLPIALASGAVGQLAARNVMVELSPVCTPSLPRPPMEARTALL